MSALTPHYLRDRDGPQGHRVTFPELLFDLVFVLTIIQLSHALAAHYSPLGVYEAALLLFAVWWVWMYTTWFANWLDPDQWPVRLALFALMFGGLVLAVSIPGAFAERGLGFALAYVAMQLGRAAFTIWALSGNFRQRNFIRVTLWLGFASVFWIAGGLADGGARIALWTVAVAVDYAAPAASFRVPVLGRSGHAEWDVAGAHMAERCALFVIVCLGETILASGRVLAGAPLDAAGLAALLPAFLVTILLWWIYFRLGYAQAEAAIEASDTPGGLARSGYTYAHIAIVAGIILAAVGAEFLIAHPHDPAAWSGASALVGGPALFVAGHLWLRTLVDGRVSRAHAFGIAALGAAFAAAPWLTLLPLAWLVCLALGAVAALGAVGTPASARSTRTAGDVAAEAGDEPTVTRAPVPTIGDSHWNGRRV